MKHYLGKVLNSETVNSDSSNYFLPFCFVITAEEFAKQDLDHAINILFESIDCAKRMKMSNAIQSHLYSIVAGLYYKKMLLSTTTTLQINDCKNRMLQLREHWVSEILPAFYVVKQNADINPQIEITELSPDEHSQNVVSANNPDILNNDSMFLELRFSDLDERFISKMRLSSNELAMKLKEDRDPVHRSTMHNFIKALISEEKFWKTHDHELLKYFRTRVYSIENTVDYENALNEFVRKEEVVHFFINNHLLNQGWSSWFLVFYKESTLTSLINVFCAYNLLNPHLYSPIVINGEKYLKPLNEEQTGNTNSTPIYLLCDPTKTRLILLQEIRKKQDLYRHLSSELIVACKTLSGGYKLHKSTARTLSANLGNAEDCLKLAEDYDHDNNHSEAIYWYKKAIFSKCSGAEFKYGLSLMLESPGTNGDFSRGLYFIHRAALQQHAPAASVLKEALEYDLIDKIQIDLKSFSISSNQTNNSSSEFKSTKEGLENLLKQKKYFQALCSMKFMGKQVTSLYQYQIYMSQALLGLELYATAEKWLDQCIEQAKHSLSKKGSKKNDERRLFLSLCRDKAFLLIKSQNYSQAYQLLIDIDASTGLTLEDKKIVYPLLAYIYEYYYFFENAAKIKKTLEDFISPLWYIKEPNRYFTLTSSRAILKFFRGSATQTDRFCNYLLSTTRHAAEVGLEQLRKNWLPKRSPQFISNISRESQPQDLHNIDTQSSSLCYNFFTHKVADTCPKLNLLQPIAHYEQEIKDDVLNSDSKLIEDTKMMGPKFL